MKIQNRIRDKEEWSLEDDHLETCKRRLYKEQERNEEKNSGNWIFIAIIGV